MEHQELTISWDAILKISLTVVALYIIYNLKDLIIWFVFALIIAVLFNYVIDFLEKKKIPRSVSTIFLYTSVFALMGFSIYKTAPLFLSELQDFSKNLPSHLKKISPLFEQFGIQIFQSTESFTYALQKILTNAQENIFQAIFSLFGGAFSASFVIFLAFFLSLEKNLTGKILTAFSSEKHKEYFLRIWGRARQKVSGWFISRLVGALFVAGASYLSLIILNVKYAFVVSIIAGILDFVPIIGPLIGTSIAILIAIINSWVQAIFVGITFALIQAIENNLVCPILFRRFVGLPPILTLISFVVGAKMWGALGAILTIPLAGVIFEITKDYLSQRKDKLQPNY